MAFGIARLRRLLDPPEVLRGSFSIQPLLLRRDLGFPTLCKPFPPLLHTWIQVCCVPVSLECCRGGCGRRCGAEELRCGRSLSPHLSQWVKNVAEPSSLQTAPFTWS